MIHFGFEPYFSSLLFHHALPMILNGSFGRKYRGFGQMFFRVFIPKIGKIAYFHAEMAAHPLTLFSIILLSENPQIGIVANMQLKQAYLRRNFNTLKIFDFLVSDYVVIVYFCQENGSI